MKFIGNKNIIINIYRIQAYDSIMCRYFLTGFIDFMLKGNFLLDYTNLFRSNDYDKNHKIILQHSQWLKRWKNHIVLFVEIIENYTFFYKQSIFDPRPKNCWSFSKKSPPKIV